MASEVIAFSVNLRRNQNKYNAAYGKHYARVEYKETLGIDDMARHMAQHNTPFSVGTITGILRDFVDCTRELCLNGNTVKVDNLAIFKCSIDANGLTLQEGYQVKAGLGTMPQAVTADTVQPAVSTVRLLAQATGEFTRRELNGDASFRWTKDAQKQIDALTNPAPAGTSGEGGEG